MRFEDRAEVERFQQELAARLRKLGLEPNPSNTRLIEFGRYAEGNWKRKWEGKPETFDSLAERLCCLAGGRAGWNDGKVVEGEVLSPISYTRGSASGV